MLHVQSGLSTCHLQADSSNTWMLSPQGKGDIPRRCFPNSNSGQECCTALLSGLHWESGPTDLNRVCSTGNQSIKHTYLYQPFPFDPPNNATKLSQPCKWLGTSWSVVADLCQHQQGLVILTVWYSNLLEVGTLSWWPPKGMNVIRTKPSWTNSTWSWKKSKLKHVFPLGWLILSNPVWEHTKLPYSCVLSSGLSQNQRLGTSPHCLSALLYLFTNDITLSCPIIVESFGEVEHVAMQNFGDIIHITMWSFGDVMLFW